MPPLEGEVPNEREAEGFVRKLSKKTPQSARPGCQLPFQGSQGGFPTRTVGADRIRPQRKAPLRGACVPGRLLVDPYRACANRFLGSTEPGGSENQCIGTSPVHYCPAALPPGRILSAPTGAVETMRLQQPTEYTPSADGVYKKPAAYTAAGGVGWDDYSASMEGWNPWSVRNCMVCLLSGYT